MKITDFSPYSTNIFPMNCSTSLAPRALCFVTPNPVGNNGPVTNSSLFHSDIQVFIDASDSLSKSQVLVIMRSSHSDNVLHGHELLSLKMNLKHGTHTLAATMRDVAKNGSCSMTINETGKNIQIGKRLAFCGKYS